MNFPNDHYLNQGGRTLIRQADVILSLDWIDLAGSLRQACLGQFPDATVIQCSVDQYCHNGWSMDHQALPAVDLPGLVLREAAVLVPNCPVCHQTLSLTARALEAGFAAPAAGQVTPKQLDSTPL